jgi:aspartate-semialdehyde dehydrogenase
MDVDKKLIVPEVNGDTLTATDFIIANPNCSTVQMVMVLKPLHDRWGVKRVVVSTYQSVSGTGAKAIEELARLRAGSSEYQVYPHRIDGNVLPHIDVFDAEGNTKEEQKMVLETVKILGDASVRVAATCVRVPVVTGHSESLNIEFHKPYELAEVRQVLAAFPGVEVLDGPAENSYPMPLQAAGKDAVFVGRLRRDLTLENGLQAWVVADNLRKGAATNAVQIAETLVAKGFV